MLLETSNVTSNFGKKVHIKKGYYQSKLLSVKLFADKEGTPIVGEYGQKLIFEFEVWKSDDKDMPTEPMKDNDGNNVVLSKFVYHRYKDTAKDGTWVEGKYRTAITPNSKGITKVLTALGWKFSEDAVDPESFVGNFVELNIDDYEYTKNNETNTISSIKDISEATQIKSTEPKETTPEVQIQIDKLEESRKNLDNLKSTNDLTEKGYTDAIEQIEHDIKKLKA